MVKIILLFFILHSGISYSQNSWIPAGQITGSADYVYTMTSNHAGDLFASVWANGIYRSVDHGASWSFSGLGGKRVSCLAVSDNGDIYGISITQNFSYIHRSTDNGLTWTDVFTGSFPLNYAGGGAIVFPSDGSVTAAISITVGPLIGNVAIFVFRSTNGGDSFFQTQRIDAGFARGMLIIPDGRIFLGTSTAGVQQSGNNGNSFTTLSTFPSIFIKTILKGEGNFIYVSDAFGLNRSSDNGATWISAGSQNSTSYLRAAQSNSNGDLFISTDDRKVFISTNNGDNWTMIMEGLPSNSYVYSFASADGKMYAGTNISGVYVYDDLTNIKENTAAPSEYHLYQNFPNPFNPVTVVKYEVSENSSVKLIIFDVAGNEVTTLVNERQNPGKYSFQWNASGFSSGVYYCKLETGSGSEVIKMILLK